MWIKGWIAYEECYRVPLIARWPGHLRPRTRTAGLVQTDHLAHTDVEAAGASLAALFDQPARKDWRKEILGAYYGSEYLYTQRLAIKNRLEYSFNGFDFDGLYALERDPGE